MNLRPLVLICVLLFWPWTLLRSSDLSAQARLKTLFHGKGDQIIRSIKRNGNQRLDIEIAISSEMDFEYVPQILGSFSKYSDWFVPYLNRHPQGHSYYTKINNLIGTDHPKTLSLVYSIDLPIYKYQGRRTFNVSVHQTPEYFQIKGKTIVSSEGWESTGTVTAFPATDSKDRTWILVKGTVQLKSWILYQSLPEKVLDSEIAPRLESLISAYQKVEAGLQKRSVSSKSKK